jgi:hypothetical protein
VNLFYKRLQRKNFSENFQMTTCGSKFNSTCGIVDGFVTTGSTEKGKSVGRPPVNEEIVEDLRQQMEQN